MFKPETFPISPRSRLELRFGQSQSGVVFPLLKVLVNSRRILLLLEEGSSPGGRGRGLILFFCCLMKLLHLHNISCHCSFFLFFFLSFFLRYCVKKNRGTKKCAFDVVHFAVRKRKKRKGRNDCLSFVEQFMVIIIIITRDRDPVSSCSCSRSFFHELERL